MSDASTSRMIEMYMEEAEAPMFLSGFFRSPPQNFHTSEKVELDIIREDPDVAVVVTDLSAGGRKNESTKYVNKAFTPPIYDEEGVITAFDMIKRSAGQDPFTDPNYAANATREAFSIARKLERKIRRSIEWQAAQVLANGALTLVDQSGNALYTLDFLAKATHKATVTTDWHAAGTAGLPLQDLAALARVVRRDGKVKPELLIFGTVAWQRFIVNQTVTPILLANQNSPGMGQVTPQVRGEGATFMGFIWIENYRFEMWTYDAVFKHPQTGTLTEYVTSDHVLMLSRQSRLDLSFGAIPRLVQPDARALSFLPPRMNSTDRGIDLSMHSWFTPDGKHLMVSAGTRPLTIPTAIDSFARLDVVQ